MVLTADGLDLETLANMGITKDRSGRLRIGHAFAKEMGLGGGRWLRREEEAKVPNALTGYGLLPEGIKAGNAYTTIERFHLAAEAGVNGVPDLSNVYGKVTADLEGKLEAASFKSSKNGLPPNHVLASYWQHNASQSELGHAPETPTQFLKGLVADVARAVNEYESGAREFVGKAKASVMTNPAEALELAVRASYMSSVAAVIKPKIEAIRAM